MSTDLGDRIKVYEAQETSRRFLPMLPIYARIDGRSFSRFTSGMKRPYDETMSWAMIKVAKILVKETHALIGYTQSDEISLCWHADSFDSEIFFSGKIFKMVSSLSAIATANFLKIALGCWPKRCTTLPTFDARVFQLPNKEECANVFLWRERDATKNAISMAARSVYSHKQLYKKNGSEMQEMLFQKGINFNDYPTHFKRGAFVRRKHGIRKLTDEELSKIPEKHQPIGPVIRSKYSSIDMPPFNKVINRVGVIFNGEEPIIDQGM